MSAPAPMSFADFGENFVRMVLHPQRVAQSVDRVLGPQLVLGPMGAGPGRKVAKIKALAQFSPTTATPVDGSGLSYLVELPVRVAFDLDLTVDTHRFTADVHVPLLLTMRLEQPLTIVWAITPPDPSAVTMTMVSGTRRGNLVRKVAGLDEELRQFLVKVVTKELSKPHVQKATHIDMLELIDGAWESLACQFLPSSPEDRAGMPEAEEPAAS